MSEPKNLPVKFVYPRGKENIQFANQFAFSQIDMDIVLDIGVVNPKEILELNERMRQGHAPAPGELEAIIIQRIGMSISSFVKLKNQMDQIFSNMEKQGVLVKKGMPDTLQ